MKKLLPLFVLLFLVQTAWCSTDTTISQARTTRHLRLEEVLQKEPGKTHPFFVAFEGLGVGKTRAAYYLNAVVADSLIVSDKLTPNFWRRLGYQSVNVLKLSGRSPQLGMALLSPIFIIAFLIFSLPFLFKLVILPPDINPVARPGNDPAVADGDDEAAQEEDPAV